MFPAGGDLLLQPVAALRAWQHLGHHREMGDHSARIMPDKGVELLGRNVSCRATIVVNIRDVCRPIPSLPL
jgi:hypothetical protein